jgi:predicted phosphodiesterase
VRVAAIADLHGHLPEPPPCDLLVLGGDLCVEGRDELDAQAAWLDTSFRGWLEAVPADAVVAIAGNHDFVFEQQPGLVPDDLPWTYLQDAGATVAGASVWGSPWTPWFGGWAFNTPRDDVEPFLGGVYAGVPDDAELLLLHGPPSGYGDRTQFGRSVGAVAAVDLVDRVQPALCVFGHIHEGRGAWQRGETRLVNAAAVDLHYQLIDDPFVVIDL